MNEEECPSLSGGRSEHLQLAIDHLPERMRTCFVLFAVNDMKQAEIAVALGGRRVSQRPFGTMWQIVSGARSRPSFSLTGPSAREEGVTAFYSTSWDNVASQALARSLGLVRVSASLWVA